MMARRKNIPERASQESEYNPVEPFDPENRQGAGGTLYDTRCDLRGARLPAGGYTRIPKR